MTPSEQNKKVGAPGPTATPGGSKRDVGNFDARIYDLAGTVQRVEERVTALKDEVVRVAGGVEKLDDKLDQLSLKFAEAKGSFKTLLWVIGIGIPIATALLSAAVQIALRHR